MTTADAAIEVGQIFVESGRPMPGSGPMSTGHYNFWEVVGLTPKRIWVQKLKTETTELVPDSDGVQYGGRRLRPLPGEYSTIKVLTKTIDRSGVQCLRIPERWATNDSDARPFDGKPVFFHNN